MCCVFFFQAEDGIRDLVRSRGLGDVYKRQPASSAAEKVQADLVEFTGVIEAINGTQWTINGQILSLIHI